MSKEFEVLGTHIDMLEERDIFEVTPTTWSEVDALREALKDTVVCLRDVYLELKEVKAELRNCKLLYPSSPQKTEKKTR